MMRKTCTVEGSTRTFTNYFCFQLQVGLKQSVRQCSSTIVHSWRGYVFKECCENRNILEETESDGVNKQYLTMNEENKPERVSLGFCEMIALPESVDFQML